MQGFRKRVMLSGLDFPFTVLVFPLYTGRDPANFFHVRFTMETPAIALQLADVGIICTLCDFGEVERWYRIEFANVVDGRTLHPDQFWELAGHLSYRSYMVPLGVQVAAMESESAVWLDLDPYVDDQRLPKASRELHEAWLQQITGAPDGLFRYDNAGSQPTTLLTPTGTLQQLAFVDFP
jgi:hypothetical protein